MINCEQIEIYNSENRYLLSRKLSQTLESDNLHQACLFCWIRSASNFRPFSVWQWSILFRCGKVCYWLWTQTSSLMPTWYQKGKYRVKQMWTTLISRTRAIIEFPEDGAAVNLLTSHDMLFDKYFYSPWKSLHNRSISSSSVSTNRKNKQTKKKIVNTFSAEVTAINFAETSGQWSFF